MLTRIAQMEIRLNRLLAAIENLTIVSLLSVREDVILLSDYMETLWIDDYKADEQGLIPKDMPRGVLAQDTLYDALCDYDRLMRETPILQTHRLSFRHWQPSDHQRLFALACDPKVGPACGWLPHKDEEESLATIRNILCGDECYALVLKETDEIVGCVDCFVNDCGNHEIGYWLGSEYWGRGLMPEAVKEMLRHCFEDLGYQEVWCGHFEQNYKSRRVIEKCGFVHSHIEPEKYHERLDENIVVYQYVITKEQYFNK